MPGNIVNLLPVIIGSPLALGLLVGAFSKLHRKRLIDDLPTSRAQGVFIGLTELKGTAEIDSPITSYLAGIQCVYYSWKVEEHWSRTVTETYRDSKGHMQTRTRTESGWTNIASGGQALPFYLKDDTGLIRVQPEGAEIQSNDVFNQTIKRDNPLYFEKGPSQEIANTTHKRRFQEFAIPHHAVLYIMGKSRERTDIVAAEIAHDKSAPLFLISTRTEKQISSGFGLWVWMFTLLGLFVAIGSGVTWVLLNHLNSLIDWQPVVIMVVGYLIVLLLGWIWMVYNSLISLRNRVNQAWSQVDVQLKRRADLIPNLVKAVEGYRNYEKETQIVLAEIRGQMDATPPGITGPDYKGLSPILRVVVERFPELKASDSFLNLQKSLTETEQRIALARDYFNDIATFYNTRLDIIPDRFVAALALMHQRALMSASDFERAPVNVRLAA